MSSYRHSSSDRRHTSSRDSHSRRDSSPPRHRSSRRSPGPSRRSESPKPPRDPRNLPESFGRAQEARADDDLSVLQRMKLSYENSPLNCLYRHLSKRHKVKIWTRNYKEVRGVMTGYIVAFDKHWNIILSDVDEVFLKPKKNKAPFLRAIAPNENLPDIPAKVPKKKSADKPPPPPPPPPKEDSKRKKRGKKAKAVSEKRQLKMLFIRGDNIVIVCPAEDDSEEEDEEEEEEAEAEQQTVDIKSEDD